MFKRWIIAVTILFLLGYVFRFHIVSRVQLYILKSCNQSVHLTTFAKSPLPIHNVYQLRSIQKFFPHRVNSLQMLQFLYKDFSGFECDVSIDTLRQQLFLAHDNILPESNVLEQFFFFDKERKIFWLDVKNLTPANLSFFKAELQKLDAIFNIKHRIIIESSELHCLEQLTKEGYLTSYYLPVVNSGQASINQSAQRGCVSNVSLLSQDILYHKQVTAACAAKKQLTWDLSFAHSFSKKVLQQHLNDTTLLVCLLNIKAPGYR